MRRVNQLIADNFHNPLLKLDEQLARPEFTRKSEILRDYQKDNHKY